mgnify:CR=1 FL=1
MEDGLQNKIERIQVLRFFAAFSVMMVHLPIFGFGIWGVDIFFVISGFIMMYVTENNEKHFFIKRIFRIVPLYWILTIGVFFIAFLKPDYLNNTTANIEHLIKSLFFIPFDKNGIGHFPVLFLGWTLNFEIIFYLIFGVSLFFFKKNRFLFCSLLIILFYFINLFLSKENFIFKTYADDMFFEFIFGMAAYIIWKKFGNNYSSNSFVNISSLFLLIFLILLFKNFKTLRFLNYGLPSFFLLIYFLFFLDKIKFPKVFIMLGDASYCIYLIHPYLIQFFYKILDISKFSFFIESIFTIFIILCVFLISIIIYKFIEAPINQKLRNKILFR